MQRSKQFHPRAENFNAGQNILLLLTLFNTMDLKAISAH
jgi:hypothetical protein